MQYKLMKTGLLLKKNNNHMSFYTEILIYGKKPVNY